MIDDRSTSRRVFRVFNGLFMILLMAVTLYPLWYEFVISISNGL